MNSQPSARHPDGRDELRPQSRLAGRHSGDWVSIFARLRNCIGLVVETFNAMEATG